jgi:hypothetical protein
LPQPSADSKESIMQLINRRTIAIPRNLGTLLLAAWLIAVGTVSLLSLGSPVLSAVLNLLAVFAGVMLLLERR